jgi:hypothetical protein
MRCPLCKLSYPEGTKECSCGYDFEAGKAKPDKKIGLVSHYKSAYVILYVLGGVILLLAILIYAFPVLNALGNWYFFAAYAAIFIISGILVQTESPAALVATIVCLTVYGLDSLVFLLAIIISSRINVFATVLRVLIIIALIKSVDTASELRKLQKSQPKKSVTTMQ